MDDRDRYAVYPREIQAFPGDDMGMKLRKPSPIWVLPDCIGESGIESINDSFRTINIKRSLGAEDSQIINPVDMVGMAVGVEDSVQMGYMGPYHLAVGIQVRYRPRIGTRHAL